MKQLYVFLILSLLAAGCATPPKTSQQQTQVVVSEPARPATALPSPTATPQPTSTASTSFTHIYAFGDELSENGNCAKLFKEALSQGLMDEKVVKILTTQFWPGGGSNGPPAVEVLADRLNVDLTDYAFCSATSGHENYQSTDNSMAGSGMPAFENKGLLGQIDEFEADLNGQKADAAALYVLEASSDDFYAYMWYFVEAAVPDLADQALANITTAVTHLAKLGAKQIMVGNLQDLTTVPAVVAIGSVDEAREYQTRYNSRLPGEMKKLAQQLGVKIKVFDYTAVSDRIRSNPGQYGLTNLTDPCMIVNTDEWVAEPCAAPYEYYYWHVIQLSSRVQQIMGEAMEELLSK